MDRNTARCAIRSICPNIEMINFESILEMGDALEEWENGWEESGWESDSFDKMVQELNRNRVKV